MNFQLSPGRKATAPERASSVLGVSLPAGERVCSEKPAVGQRLSVEVEWFSHLHGKRNPHKQILRIVLLALQLTFIIPQVYPARSTEQQSKYTKGRTTYFTFLNPVIIFALKLSCSLYQRRRGKQKEKGSESVDSHTQRNTRILHGVKPLSGLKKTGRRVDFFIALDH